MVATDTQLTWLVSWDGLMHAFTREQPCAEFAVTAICRHISRLTSVHKGQAMQCAGCLVAMGSSMTQDADARWQ